jgi:hypothetical protein
MPVRAAKPPITPPNSPWTAEAGGKWLVGNDDHSPVLYKLKAGADPTEVMKAARRNGMKEVAFTTSSGDHYVIQSQAMRKGLLGLGLPSVGEAVSIKDKDGATVISGTITDTDSDWTRWLNSTAVGAGVAGVALAGLSMVGLPVTIALAGTGAQPLGLGASAGGAAGLLGLSGASESEGKSVIRPNTVPDAAESAIQLL